MVGNQKSESAPDNDNTHLIPPGAVIVPSKQDMSLETWRPLSKVPHLFAACAIAPSGTGIEMQGDTFMMLDSNFSSYDNGKIRASCLYTDRKLLKPHTSYAKFDTRWALSYVFHSELVNAIAFNKPEHHPGSEQPGRPDFTYPFASGHAVIPKSFIPTLIGLVSSGNLSADGTTHSTLAQAALDSDDIYCAYYHAESAREAGEPPLEYAGSLITALGFLGMWQEAANYFHSFRSNGIHNARIDLIYARLLAFSRDPEEAFRVVDSLLDNLQVNAEAWCTKGHLWLQQQDNQKASVCFEKAAMIAPDFVPALVGWGVALRNLHYQFDDLKYIEPARRALKQACALARFHQPEAFHHLGTLAIAIGDWPEAQSYCEQALALQNNPISLKNLILSLHAQGKMDEAKQQYGYLCYSHREVANTISHYFQQS